MKLKEVFDLKSSCECNGQGFKMLEGIFGLKK